MQLSEAYKIIVGLQKKLHSELATSANFEEVFNYELSQQFNKDFIDQMITDKQYYSLIFFMNYFKEEKKPPFTNSNALFLTEVSKKEEQIPEIFSIYEEKEKSMLFSTLKKLYKAKVLSSNLNSKSFTDFVTYSLIPSLYLMFMEYDSFNLFCNLISKFKNKNEIGKISDPLHYTLSRSLFVSPIFLKFIHQTIYPCIKPFYENNFSFNSEKDTASAQKNILQSFKKNICFIPSYIIMFLQKMKDTKNFLNKSLFEPMLENPECYLIIDSPLTDFEDIMKNIKIFLKSIFTPDIIDDIAKIIDSCKESEKALFVPKKKKSEQTYVYKKVINSFDINAFSLINKMLQSDNNDNENKQIDLFGSFNAECLIYKAIIENEQEIVQANVYNKTKIGMNDCWMYFRKLLKDSPPLPINYQFQDKPIDKENFLELVKTLLVNTDDPFTSVDAVIAYNFFEKNFKKVNESSLSTLEDFEEIMNGLVKTHREQAIEMKKLSQFRSELAVLKLKKDSSIKSIKELYCTILTSSIPHPADLPNANKNKKLLLNILSDPTKYKRLFKDYLAQQGPKSQKLVGSNCYQIWYHRFFHCINFANYCAYRSDLNRFDAIVQKVFMQYVSKINEIQFKSKATQKAIQHLDMFTDQFLQLNKAFESNDDPLTKLISIGEAFDQILLYFWNQFNGEGEDDFTPFRNVVISFINPPRFVSNIVYILEYVMCIQPQIVADNIFNRLFTSLLSVFQDMEDQTFIHNSIYYYSRPNHRRMEVFITGSSSKSITKLLESFVYLSNNQPPDKKSLDRYADLIEKDARAANHISLDIVDFIDNNRNVSFTGDVCAITDVYFGKNIQFKSNTDSQPDIKIALYALVQDKSKFKNIKDLFGSETKALESSKDIKNEYKFVVYDTTEEIPKLPQSQNIKLIPFNTLGSAIVDVLRTLSKIF